jgi:hypothetical protein
MPRAQIQACALLIGTLLHHELQNSLEMKERTNVDKATGTVVHSTTAGVVRLSVSPPRRQRIFPERIQCVGI